MAKSKKTSKKSKAPTKGSTSRSKTKASSSFQKPTSSSQKAAEKEGGPVQRSWIRGSAAQEVVAITLLGVTFFLLLSLVSNLKAGGDEGRNICGDLGHLVSDNLILATGIFSFALPAIMFAWSLMILLEKRITHFSARALAAFVLLLSLATLGDFVLPPDGPRGGGIGAYLKTTLESRLSTLGSMILLATIFLAATVVATDWLLVTLLSRAFSNVRQRFVLVTANNTSPASTVAIEKKRKRAVAKNPIVPQSQESNDDSPPRKTSTKPGSGPSSAEQETIVAELDPETDPAVAQARSDKSLFSVLGKSRKSKGSKAGKKQTKSTASPASEKPNAPAAASIASSRPDDDEYSYPPLDLLAAPRTEKLTETPEEIRRKSLILVHTLRNFKIEADVVEFRKGPVITLYELELAAGIKVSRIVSFSDDLAMALAAESVRIVAPIPGKSTVGIEVPNTFREIVTLRELFEHPEFRKKVHAIPLMLGKDAAGNPIIEDLAEMPHLLIAGATGAGKSVCINSIILSILVSRSPADVEMILIDPKMVELSMFAKVPHLLTPVVTDMKRAPFILEWAVQKMEERYELLAAVGVRNIASFNALGADKIRERLTIEGDEEEEEEEEEESDPERDIVTHLPYVVIVVDELADLMMTASKEIEISITRLCQKSRAVGIHIILATQRPSVDVITGLIKSNMPARISFKVASKVDSRTILDRNGAEKLLGQGDMLYLPPRTSEISRAQGTFLSDKEIRSITKHLKKTSTPEFNNELAAIGTSGESEGASKDDLFEAATRIVLESQRGSVSLLQRQLGVGYTRAARLIDLMAKDGLVGKYKGSQAREVLISLEEWEEGQEKKSKTKQRSKAR